EISLGKFREDLYWRLHVVPIYVPPLRERIEDIPLLVEDFLDQCYKKGLGRKQLLPAALEVMANHTWPGNVRELKNFVERVAIMCLDSTITAEIVATFLKPDHTAAKGISPTWGVPYQHLDFKEAKRSFEREYIRHRLSIHSGNISLTADQIGLERSHLHRKIKSLDLDGAIDPIDKNHG
ncbi:MAG: helix-turn-helix domain-containing protein, partial [Pseudomonadota bacterium]